MRSPVLDWAIDAANGHSGPRLGIAKVVAGQRDRVAERCVAASSPDEGAQGMDRDDERCVEREASQ